MSKQTESFPADILEIFVGFIVFSFSFNKVRHDILNIKWRDIILRVNQRNPLCRPREITIDGRRLLQWFTCRQVLPLLRKIILPTIFYITDDPAAGKTNRYRTYASIFPSSNGNNYKGQKILQSVYLWDNSAFVASDRAPSSLAVPLRNDNHSLSLSLVICRGQLPLINCTFSSAEKKGHLWKICGTLHKFSSLSHTNLIDVDPIASLWCLLTRIPLDCLGGVLNSDKSYSANSTFHLNVRWCNTHRLLSFCRSHLFLSS